MQAIVGTVGRVSGYLITAILLIGCVGAGVEQYGEEDAILLPVDTTVQRTPGLEPDRESTMDGFILIEGMREPMTFRLYRTPAAFPLTFATYLPEDMEAEEVTSGEGSAVRFAPTFGGEAAERAVLSITVPPGEWTAVEAQQMVRNVAGTQGVTERVTGGGYTWALEEYRFQADDLVGSVALGRHDGRYFYVITAYPVEMGDGFGPRAARILGEWRWADGSRLGS